MADSKILPPAVAAFLNGEQLEEKQNEAMHFLTVDDNGFPYKAMVSVGEVLAYSKDRLRIALWSGTQTDNNAMRSKKAVLLLVTCETAFDIQLMLEPIGRQEGLALYEGRVLHVKADQAPYAKLESAVRFTLKDPDASLAHWRHKLELLKN
ncbi:hypothetical protein SFC23_14650 [Shouchella clausii]|uniref:hypothetical protein n=1 Tax=Shouchella clausii TaxID=79880 RepID=UPI000BA576A3|nr:hypothetical protein [Shouchella clausii]PAD91437.1 hypothetical protein CHH52_14945 [Shouchella clausii]GIN11945.1 hypothetical protein J26TS2_18120 [Shouchella clausii]